MYAASAKPALKFSADNINGKINRIRYPNSYGRNLPVAVRSTYWQFFAKTPTYIHRALVIVVGGRQTSRNYRLLRRMKRKLRKHNVFVHVVAVGRAEHRYVSALNRKVIRVRSFRSLISKARVVGRAICEEMVSEHVVL